VTVLLDHLQARRAAGRKLLVPYVMGGRPSLEGWPDAFSAVAGFADAVEIGLPYSDPLMDGPVIAGAGERAIRDGVGPLEVLDSAAGLPAEVPRVVMTYYNPIHRLGEAEFCRRAAKSGIGGLIVPDLPVEESSSLREAAADAGLGWIPLVAPTSSPERVSAITATATGFVYAVSTLGVTGARESLSERAAAVVARCREATDLPVLVGIGVTTAGQAVEAVESADGVVIGSAVVGLIEERGAEAAGEFLEEVRTALAAL
jgi:tryptophan synthase alpha chain